MQFQSIQEVCKILGELMSGSEITKMFKQLQLKDLMQNSTKWRRLEDSIMNRPETLRKPTTIRVIEWYMQPVSFRDNPEAWEIAKLELNQILQFEGLMVNDSGNVIASEKIFTYADGRVRYQNLMEKLKNLDVHETILRLCTPEIVSLNYFHLVFESAKLPFDFIKAQSTSSFDGADLINRMLNMKSPKVILNKLETPDQKNQHQSLRSGLEYIHYTYRNPKAHQVKAFNPSSESEAIGALLIISKTLSVLHECQILVIAE